MKISEKAKRKYIEEWLNERWLIANMEAAKPQDMTYYAGAIKALEFAGYDWQRNTEGKHTLYRWM